MGPDPRRIPVDVDREPAVPILLAFLGFVLFAREGLVGIGRQGTARLPLGAGSGHG